MAGTEYDQALEGVRIAVTRIVTDSTYSSKGHFNAAQGLNRLRLALGGVVVTFATVASGGTFASGLLPVWVVGVCAIIAAAVGGVSALFDSGGRAARHERLGTEYLTLKKDAQHFLDVQLRSSKRDSQEAAKELDTFILRQHAVDIEAMSTPVPGWAYERARQGVRRGEARY